MLGISDRLLLYCILSEALIELCDQMVYFLDQSLIFRNGLIAIELLQASFAGRCRLEASLFVHRVAYGQAAALDDSRVVFAV